MQMSGAHVRPLLHRSWDATMSPFDIDFGYDGWSAAPRHAAVTRCGSS